MLADQLDRPVLVVAFRGLFDAAGSATSAVEWLAERLDGVEVGDGDTLIVDLAGRHETVRLLGIDTPETVHPDRPPECFGAEASERLRLLLAPGAGVRIQRDVEPRDRYGRLLAYVERLADGLSVNRSLVESGHAAALHIDPNDALRHELAAAESRARSDDRGLWGACGGPHAPLA